MAATAVFYLNSINSPSLFFPKKVSAPPGNRTRQSCTSAWLEQHNDNQRYWEIKCKI